MPSTSAAKAQGNTPRSGTAGDSKKTLVQQPTKSSSQQGGSAKGVKEGRGYAAFTEEEIKKLRNDTSPFC